MEDVINFLEANYLWVIIIAAVLIITLIGYIADKKGFGKPKSKKKRQEEEIEVKQDIVQIPDVQETINNLDENLEEEPQNYASEMTDEDYNEKIESDQNIRFKEEVGDEYNGEPIERISYDSFEGLEPQTDEISTLNEEEINDDIENNINEDQLGENLELESNLDLENTSNEGFEDLFKQETVPEKIEVPDAEPTETLNIDNDFNRLLNDVDSDEDTIEYELPKIESIDSTDLTDDDIWKF